MVLLWFLVSDVVSAFAFHAIFLVPAPVARRLSLATAVLLFTLGHLAGAADAWRVARSRRALGPPLGRPWLRAVAALNSRDSRHRGCVTVDRVVARLAWWLYHRSAPDDFGEPIER